ncbi:FkbH-like protein [Sphingomonas sp. SORGH_AS802]|uniref:HAD-IIIC family phosphatase n=1 Tax=unclassified Sphingomonas TaxID=196159 RepID=UPI0028627180|nr:MULTISPECIES: HAD-IIIC family phosphatase [unclassified Sphingomonas]MDR6126234.1 FkbH-like protein [Sphingomonas sp. SORGH_AS_0438]MDR6135920.1 FkbH-like protein [Sphingomonas sp. SORGH_AS_0802]
MIKLVIWDLDETLWHGTLDAGDTIRLIEERAELVRALNAHGIVSAICSKNDFATARAQLEAFGLWDEFVFPEIAYQPKGEAIATILADMQLRAENTLFIDDNHVNLNEAMFRLPGLSTLDATLPTVESDLRRLLTDQAASRNRVAEYRSLQAKRDDRRTQGQVSDEAFLRSCDIKVCAVRGMGILDYLPRVVELVARSNQLNYSKSRISSEHLYGFIMDGSHAFDCYTFFASDRYGDHGLVGFGVVDNATKNLIHFVFSCRVMHMGIESWAIEKIQSYHTADLIIPGDWVRRWSRESGTWISEQYYHEPEVRTMLLNSQHEAMDTELSMRLMASCQSGGIAHYSKFRSKIDADLYPREFDLARFIDGCYVIPDCPKFIVYDAGSQYRYSYNTGIIIQTDIGLYEACVEHMCQFLEFNDIKALILLPPEDLESDAYRNDALPKEVFFALNSIWRRMLLTYGCITLFDIGVGIARHDIADARHLRQNGPKTLAGYIDQWFEIVTQSEETQSIATTSQDDQPRCEAA